MQVSNPPSGGPPPGSFAAKALANPPAAVKATKPGQLDAALYDPDESDDDDPLAAQFRGPRGAAYGSTPAAAPAAPPPPPADVQPLPKPALRTDPGAQRRPLASVKFLMVRVRPPVRQGTEQVAGSLLQHERWLYHPCGNESWTHSLCALLAAAHSGRGG